jgi:hypothetical protein
MKHIKKSFILFIKTLIFVLIIYFLLKFDSIFLPQEATFSGSVLH